ncbi:protein NYNRIN-like [Scylla paramamosain]|uniref:protein NYNRIN-like n=1 Tax=Scylla paramamosain TaxID=85552 RepID=UPI0030836694
MVQGMRHLQCQEGTVVKRKSTITAVSSGSPDEAHSSGCSGTTTCDSAEVLVEQFFTRFGVLGELHSNQGCEFEEEVFSKCCHLLGLQKMMTKLKPQSDGMIEHFNRTLTQELAKYCKEGKTEWDRKLPALLMAYRSTMHEATTYLPARLMMGWELQLPEDLTTGCPPDKVLPTVSTDYAIALQEQQMEAHHQLQDRLKLMG